MAPSSPPREVTAIVLVGDVALASALELALLADGLAAIVYDPAQGLDGLPLDAASVLIAHHQALPPDPLAFVETLRARPWGGLVILITGDGAMFRAFLHGATRVKVLEMPFVGADLIAAIRAELPKASL